MELDYLAESAFSIYIYLNYDYDYENKTLKFLKLLDIFKKVKTFNIVCWCV